MADTEQTRKRVFVSYSHDTAAHAARVLALADALSGNGLDVTLDQYDPNPAQGWPLWMETNLKAADFVLMVCTQTYYRRVMQEEAAGVGLGVRWEGGLTYNDLYNNPGQGKRYIPVIFDSADSQYIPGPTQGHTFYPLTDFDLSEWHFEALLRHLIGQPATPRLPIGPVPLLPPLPRGTQAAPPPANPPSALLWNVPHKRNPFFTGREDELQQLHAALVAGQTPALTHTPQPQALSGMGGLGKTQTAVEYAHRHRTEYPAVFWVRAETETLLREGFVEIARLLGRPEAQEPDGERAVQAARRWLEENPGWLLIFDNADDLTLLRPFLPASGGGHVLITTRASAMGGLARPVRLGRLSEPEGARLLLRRAGLLADDAALDAAEDEDRAAALLLTRAVDGLPLALDQAGAFIEEASSSPKRYLALYRTRGKKLRAERGDLGAGDHASVSVTFSLAVEKTERACPAAGDLIRVCAFLAPDAIPEEIFTQGASELGDLLAASVADEYEWEMTVKAACRYSLLSRDADARMFSLHRLVQEVLRDGLTDADRRLWVERTVRAVNEAFPALDFANWPLCDRLIPHAQVCATWIEAESLEVQPAARLLNQAGYYLDDQGRYGEAGVLYEQALAILENVRGPEHPDTATALSNLAMLYKNQGRFAEAEPLHQRALAIREKALGPEHPDTATSLNNLAMLYESQSRYKKAEPLYQRALAICEWSLGPEHPNTARSLNNLALLYNNQGRFAEAEPLHQRALAIREKTLGLEHPDTATSLNNLAGLYYAQSQYKEAGSLYQRALAIHEKALGPEHPATATSLNNLANLYNSQGRFAEAEPLHQRALAIREKALGPEHPDTTQSLNNLAMLYNDQGRYGEAEPLLQNVVMLLETIRGLAHPNSAGANGNLAAVLRALGREEEAQAHLARAAEIRARHAAQNGMPGL